MCSMSRLTTNKLWAHLFRNPLPRSLFSKLNKSTIDNLKIFVQNLQHFTLIVFWNFTKRPLSLEWSSLFENWKVNLFSVLSTMTSVRMSHVGYKTRPVIWNFFKINYSFVIDMEKVTFLIDWIIPQETGQNEVLNIILCELRTLFLCVCSFVGLIL